MKAFNHSRRLDKNVDANVFVFYYYIDLYWMQTVPHDLLSVYDCIRRTNSDTIEIGHLTKGRKTRKR